MFSRKILWAFFFAFLFVSFIAFYSNLPEPKNKRVYTELLQYFPYKIEKELGGIDIVDKRTGKDLDIANAQVYLAYDAMLKKWGKTHLRLKGSNLIVLDDTGKEIGQITLHTQKEVAWVRKFFGL
ncbi:hypothetical protein [Nitratiruptor sp. SB155-2]|uniref:hypothetical protein n=1 Tax=Nitratiruptor sp. (strain SB155-2) TaxID=387092 RepID=UPI0001587110|nr:hypothetical protein [Nitratiruptor sp. SB155-2]BAF70883.1 conserved hypothetical protein [Nitratiruptor sp. SB155-2]